MIDLKASWATVRTTSPACGIGEKTAKDLLVRFGTVADIYRDLDALDIKPGVQEACEKARERRSSRSTSPPSARMRLVISRRNRRSRIRITAPNCMTGFGGWGF
ncbi:MAG: hypothetical protein ACLTG4_00895 [Oscillospiraceae bacterium]